MVSASSLEPRLELIKGFDGVEAAMVVSRSGMHVAGTPPDDVHMETYVAMSAIVLGAAETAASELHEKFKVVEIRTITKKVILSDMGERGLLVLTTSFEVVTETLLDSISDIVSEMKGLME